MSLQFFDRDLAARFAAMLSAAPFAPKHRANVPVDSCSMVLKGARCGGTCLTNAGGLHKAARDA